MTKSSSFVAKASLVETQLKSFTLHGLPWKLAYPRGTNLVRSTKD
jgi:hypothetical protein